MGRAHRRLYLLERFLEIIVHNHLVEDRFALRASLKRLGKANAFHQKVIISIRT